MARLPRRLLAAWAVLRGRPVAYRITVIGGLEMPAGQRGARVVETTIKGDPAQAAVTFRAPCPNTQPETDKPRSPEEDE